MKKYLIGVILLLGMALYILGAEYSKQRQKNAVQERNITALRSSIEYYKTSDGKNAAKVQGLELNLRSYKKLYAESYNEIKDLKIKFKNASGVIQYVQKIEYKNKDSIVYVPEPNGKRYKIRDTFLSADVITTGDTLIKPGNFIINEIKNEVSIVPEVQYKGWWFWKKVKGVSCTIVNTNPFITVTDAIYIDLKKN